jgi:hypothetical protein
VVAVRIFFTFPAGGVPEAVAAHPPCKLVLFNGRIVARDGALLPAPVPTAWSVALAVTQLEILTHALVASPFRKNPGSP